MFMAVGFNFWPHKLASFIVHGFSFYVISTQNIKFQIPSAFGLKIILYMQETHFVLLRNLKEVSTA